MAYGADVAVEKVDDATRRAIEEILGTDTRTTLVLLVRHRRGNGFSVFVERDCRPGDRGSKLASHGADPNKPLRSPGYAFAWRDRSGKVHVGGTSKAGRKYLTANFHAILRFDEDIDS